MDLGKRVTISLLGTMVIIVGLFVTAVNGLVPSGINSNESMALYQMQDGQIILVMSIILLGMHATKTSTKWTWLSGLIILAFSIFSFIMTAKYLSTLPPYIREFVGFGIGYFVVFAGTIPVAISATYPMPKETKIKPITNEPKSEDSVADEIIKLADLLSKELITQKEFNIQKEKLLNREME